MSEAPRNVAIDDHQGHVAVSANRPGSLSSFSKRMSLYNQAGGMLGA
jgi:hypothetical protein